MAYEIVTDEQMQEILDAKSFRKGGMGKSLETLELEKAFEDTGKFLQAIPAGKDARKYADSIKTRLTNYAGKHKVFVKIDTRNTPPTHILVRKIEPTA
jgi:hypothetical protein